MPIGLSLFSAIAYAFFATTISLVNKILFQSYAFHCTWSLILGQLWFSVVCLKCLYLAELVQQPPSLSLHVLYKVAPVSLIFFANVFFGLAGLSLTSLPAYIAQRRLGVLFTMLLQWGWFNKRPSFDVMMSIVIIVFGGLFTTVWDESFDMLGYVYIMMNNITGALQLVMIKKVEVSDNLHTFTLMYYNNLISIPIALIFVLYFDEVNIILNQSQIELDFTFIILFILSSIWAFLLNYTLYLCTKLNSPLATSVTVQIKNSATTLLGFIWSGLDNVDNISLFGHLLSAFGGALYCYYKHLETLKSSSSSTTRKIPPV